MIRTAFKEEELFYLPQHSAENLFFVLYYSFCDGSYRHFERRTADVDSWSHDETILKSVDLLRSVSKDVSESCAEIMASFDLPDSVKAAVEEVKAIMGDEWYKKPVEPEPEDYSDEI